MGFELFIKIQESYVSTAVDNPVKGYPCNVTIMQTSSYCKTRKQWEVYLKKKPENIVTATVERCGRSINIEQYVEFSCKEFYS